MKPAGTRGAPAAEAAAAAGGGGGKAAGLAPISAAASRPAGEKVVHSRSQGLFCSGGGGGGGTQALGDALKLLVPRSTAFMSSEAELWDFLCSLRHEFSPVILRSKDVYGYASCRAVVPDLPGAWAQEDDEEEEEGRAGSSSSNRSSRRGGGGTAANNKGKAKSRRGGGGGGRSSSAKRAAKKQRSSHDWRNPMLWACEKRREPARWTPSQGSSPEPLPDPMPPILAAFPPPVKVRGDIWKRRTLEAARRRAQRLLRVDLAPVVRLRRIPLGPTCR